MSNPTQETLSQETLLQLADIAVRRQATREKCQAFARSDMKCTIQGTERLRKYQRELETLELEMENVVKKLTTAV